MPVFLSIFYFRVKPFHIHIQWPGINPCGLVPIFGGFIFITPSYSTLPSVRPSSLFPSPHTHLSSKMCTIMLCFVSLLKTPPAFGEKTLSPRLEQECCKVSCVFPTLFWRHFQAFGYLQTTQNKSSLVLLCCWTITSKNHNCIGRAGEDDLNTPLVSQLQKWRLCPRIAASCSLRTDGFIWSNLQQSYQNGP